MRDIIWTLILVWFVYKIVEVFRLGSAKRNGSQPEHQQTRTQHSTQRPEKDIRNAIKKHINKEGEYIDFEEIK